MKAFPFRDSTLLIDDDPALRHRLCVDGYLFLRGVVPRNALARTAAAMMSEVVRAGWLRAGTDHNERIADSSRACAEPDAAFRAVYDRVFRLEAFHALPHFPGLIDLMRRLLGGETVLIHPRKIARLIFPVVPGMPDFTTPPHQDYWAIQGEPDTYSVWIPLHDCPFDEGSLMVAEGSHRNGIYGYRLCLGAGGVEVDDPLEGQWRGGDFAAGDILVFSTLAVHGAAPNRTDRLRLSIDCRFQRANDPINEECIRLSGVPYDWADLYTDWAHDGLKYYWKALKPRTVRYDPRYYQRRDELALDEGEKGNPAAISALQRLVKAHPDAAVRERAAALVERLSGAPV